MNDDDACARRCSIVDGADHRAEFFCARILCGNRMISVTAEKCLVISGFLHVTIRGRDSRASGTRNRIRQGAMGATAVLHMHEFFFNRADRKRARKRAHDQKRANQCKVIRARLKETCGSRA